MTVNEIIDLLETLSPTKYACDFDNVGLHVGDRNQKVNKLLITLDIDDMAVDRAINEGFDMIVSHHPLIFGGINKVNSDDYIGRRVLRLASAGISAYCMHTNYDCVGGMASQASDRLQLINPEVLEEVMEGEGIGRVGDCEACTLTELIDKVKKTFNLQVVSYYGADDMVIDRIAICPGSGKSMVELALSKGAKAYVTGDINYHSGIDSIAQGMAVIDAGHYGLEHIFIEHLNTYLSNNTKGVEIICMDINNPQKYK